MVLSVVVLLAASISPRSVIDLNSGWEFARVPQAPSIWRAEDAVTTSEWRVIAVSSEETAGELADARRAFDGNPQTFWHSEWSRRQARYPHELVIDLGVRAKVAGFRLLPRQSAPQNGRPNHCAIYLSESSATWGRPVIEAAIPDSPALFERRFPTVHARFLRVVVTDGHRNGEPFLAISEIGLIQDRSAANQTDWQSQYNIVEVTTGDRRYDLHSEDLNRLKALEVNRVGTQGWSSAVLPHASWIRPLNSSAIWQGVTYYRRQIDSVGIQGRIEFQIDGAMQSADLWLNGKLIASRRGGYMPLLADLTGKLKAKNELLLRVDNSDNPLIPPGKPQSELDFMYGAGVTRGASLTLSNSLYITNALSETIRFGGGIYVSYPEVGTRKAIVRIRTHVRNRSGARQIFRVRQSILDSSSTLVSTTSFAVTLATGAAERWQQDLEVPRPQLWTTAVPNLYTVLTELVAGNRVVDRVETRIGIRAIAATRSGGFTVNGKPLRLVGTNRHQDYPWIGPALSNAANRRDAVLIKRSGHNIVRLSHYPQSPAFLDACDELGILVIPCIPGWQFQNRDPRFIASVARDIREMIRRDRNHPSVAFWEAGLNETYPNSAVAKSWFDIAKSELAEGAAPLAGDGANGAPWDVVYNGWNEDLSRPQDMAPDRPGYIREYGDYEFGGARSSSRVRISQGVSALLQETWNHVWSYNQFRPQYPWTMGAGTWEMFDHNVPWDFEISASGLADIFRREKPSFWFFQSQKAAQPYLKVAANWQPGLATRTVVAFTNCQMADLIINGKLVRHGISTPGVTTSYTAAKPFDGSNTANLPHPPIVFRDVPFTVGELRVVARASGSRIVSDSVRSAGRPVKLKLWVDELGVPAVRNDVIFVRAAIVDANGVICIDESRTLKFTVRGAMIAGEASSSCEMGVASILVRTPTHATRASVQAVSSDGLVGRCEFAIR